MYRFLRMGLFLLISASVLTMLLCRAVPQDWETALKIRCTEMEMLGTDDNATTITENSGIIIEGAKLGVGGTASDAPKSMIELQDTTELSMISGVTDSYFGYNMYTEDDGVTMLRLVADNDVAFIGCEATGRLAFYTQSDANATADSAITWIPRFVSSEVGFYVYNDASATIFGIDHTTEKATHLGDFDIAGVTDLQGGFELASVAVTTTAAEANFNDGSIAGTAVANKTLVLGSQKNVDTFQVDGALNVGGSVVAGAVSATANIQAGDSLVTTNHLFLVGGDLLVGDPITTISQTELKLLDGKTFVNLDSYGYRLDNVPASQTKGYVYYLDHAGSLNDVEVPFEGTVVGLSIKSSASVGTGTLTVYPGAQAQEIHANCKLELGVGESSDSTTFAAGTYTSPAGNNLTMLYDTSADWAPNTLEVAVTVWLEF